MSDHAEGTAAMPEFFKLGNHLARIRYFFIAVVVVLAVRMLENTVHEYAHVAMVLLSGGGLTRPPLVTPFGGVTWWHDVAAAWLPAVNISGTAVSAAVMLGIFLPVYFKARHPWLRWLGYWGGCVVPVNTFFYWFMAPFLATNPTYDPIAFAMNVGLEPTWLIGIIACVPFSIAAWWMVKSTRSIESNLLVDPARFHFFCLILYYVISIGFPVVSYLNLLDQLAFW